MNNKIAALEKLNILGLPYYDWGKVKNYIKDWSLRQSNIENPQFYLKGESTNKFSHTAIQVFVTIPNYIVNVKIGYISGTQSSDIWDSIPKDIDFDNTYVPIYVDSIFLADKFICLKLKNNCMNTSTIETTSKKDITMFEKIKKAFIKFFLRRDIIITQAGALPRKSRIWNQ